MGLADSPYRSVQAFMWAKEWIMGDGKERVVPGTGRRKPGKGVKSIPMKDIEIENPFWWVDVVLNLPGDPDYDLFCSLIFKNCHFYFYYYPNSQIRSYF